MTDPAIRAVRGLPRASRRGRPHAGRRHRSRRAGLDRRALAGRRVVGSRLRLDGDGAPRPDRYRYDLGWLPDSERIALSVVEHHGGVKVIYDDGRVLEFGIATIESFQHWVGNTAKVYVDKGGVADAVAALIAQPASRRSRRPRPIDAPADDPAADRVGSARRGEISRPASTSGPKPSATCSSRWPRRCRATGASRHAQAPAAVRIRAPRAVRADRAGGPARPRGRRPCAPRPRRGAARRAPEFPRDGAAAIRNRLGWSYYFARSRRW